MCAKCRDKCKNAPTYEEEIERAKNRHPSRYLEDGSPRFLSMPDPPGTTRLEIIRNNLDPYFDQEIDFRGDDGATD